MTMPSGEVAGSNARKWKRRQRWLILSILTTAVVLATGIAGALRQRTSVSPPPAVELADSDPAVAAALREAQDAVRASPRSSAAWGRLGMLLFNYNFLPESRDCFTQAQRLAPREPSWSYYHALTLLSENPPEAIVLLQRTVELCGDNPDAPRLRLAELLMECGQAEEAETQFHLAWKANPESSRAQLGLARLAYERGDLQASRALLDRAVRSDYTERNARTLLAQVEQRLGDKQTAERERDRAEAIAKPPSWPDPYLQKLQQLRVGRQAGIDRISALLAEDHVAEAGATAEEVVRDYPTAGLAWLLLGEARMRQQQPQAAEAALQRAVQLMPQSVESHFALGTALFLQNEYAEAASYFRRVAELKPTSANAYYNLGQCLVKLDDAEGAEKAFQKAVNYQPQFANAHRNLGELLARRGRVVKAAEHLRAALQINPNDAAARRGLDELLKQSAAADGSSKKP